MKTTLLCPQCHNPVGPDDIYCGNCRHQLKADSKQNPAQAQTVAPQAAPVNPQATVQSGIAAPIAVAGNANRNGMATTAMVLGLVVFFSLPISVYVLPQLIFFNLIGGIIAIVIGAIAHSSQFPGRATAGIVLSALSLSGIALLIGLFIYAEANCKNYAYEDSGIGSFCAGYLEGKNQEEQTGTFLQPAIKQLKAVFQ